MPWWRCRANPNVWLYFCFKVSYWTLHTLNMAEIGSQSKVGSRNLSFLTRSRPNKRDLSPNSVWQDMNGLDELIRLVRIIKKLIWMWYFALFNWFSNVKCQIWGKISRSQIMFFCFQRISKTKGLSYAYIYEISVSEYKTRFVLVLTWAFGLQNTNSSWGGSNWIYNYLYDNYGPRVTIDHWSFARSNDF